MKAAAAVAAVDEVRSGMVVGLGTGSTAAHAVRNLARRVEVGHLADISGVATSHATEELATSLGIPLLEPGAEPIDLAIDGADEIAPDLALTKGGGGALLREKVIAAAAGRFIVISDDSKLVGALGSTFAIPLEVARFGLGITLGALERLGRPELRIRGGDVFETDNGNYVIDLHVDPISDAARFDGELHQIPGVLATGLFVGIADAAYVADGSGVRRIERRDGAGEKGAGSNG
jgi:ribose 5-phosphate isomerase A